MDSRAHLSLSLPPGDELNAIQRELHSLNIELLVRDIAS